MAEAHATASSPRQLVTATSAPRAALSAWASAVDFVSPAAAAWRRDPNLRAGVQSGVICFGLLTLSYFLFVEQCFCGLWGGPFMMSTSFGVPRATAEAGILPVYEHPTSGWDGQFYYHQSNDPLLHGDGPKWIDNPSYRYQRNLVPVLAYATSRVAGYSVTPPLWYQVIQLAFTAAGCGALVWLLREHGLSQWLSLIWILSGGIIWSLFRGLPDAPSDGLFIIAICGLYRRHLSTYVIAATMLLLCREGYAVFAATVFCLTACKQDLWNTKLTWWQRSLATSLPGVVVLAWAFYVAHQLQLPVLGGSRLVPFGGLIDWPFFAYVRAMWQALEGRHRTELIYKTLTAATIAIIFILAIKHRRQSVIALAAIPYMVLISMTGIIIWDNANGYLKATSSILVVGMLLLQCSSSRLLRWALYANLAMGIHCGYRVNLRHLTPLPPVAIDVADLSHPLHLDPPPAQEAHALADAACHIECATVSGDRLCSSTFSLFRRPLALYSVTATNTGDTAWVNSRPDKDCICLGFQVKDRSGRVVRNGRRLLRRTIQPGEEARFLVAFPLPRGRGEYELTIDMVQEKNFRFEELDPQFACRETLHVR